MWFIRKADPEQPISVELPKPWGVGAGEPPPLFTEENPAYRPPPTSDEIAEYLAREPVPYLGGEADPADPRPSYVKGYEREFAPLTEVGQAQFETWTADDWVASSGGPGDAHGPLEYIEVEDPTEAVEYDVVPNEHGYPVMVPSIVSKTGGKSKKGKRKKK